ncbi:MAG: protein-glutamate O-methyltransferase [Pseudomonadota bacterium]
MSLASLQSATFDLSQELFDHITSMVNADTGIQFLPEKRTLVQARISKRIRTLRMGSFQEYADFLNSPEGEGERKSLVSVLTTNVTRFFREEHHFDHLREEILPDLIQRARSGGRVRLWSAGCSSGEEPYSIALTALGLDRDLAKYDFKILASDLDPEVVAKAHRGVYRSSAVDTIPANLRKTFFKPHDQTTSIASDDLKAIIAFRELNLMHNWPMRGLFDVIFCRNVVIYFDTETSERIWAKFANQLESNGMLYVGHSERVGNAEKIGMETVGVTAYRKNLGR